MSCILMTKLHEEFTKFASRRGITVMYNDLEPFKRIFCSNVCHGACQPGFLRIGDPIDVPVCEWEDK